MLGHLNTSYVTVKHFDFYKYYKRHKLLHINREQFFDDAEQLPEHMDIIEYDYQELAKELYQAKQELISKNRIAKKELLDYYGMWVHQIKTPIAALDILLQNTEQFLYEEDIVNSRINKRLEIIQESIPVSDMKMELFKIEQYVEMALNYLRVEDISSDLSFNSSDFSSKSTASFSEVTATPFASANSCLISCFRFSTKSCCNSSDVISF